MYFETRSEPALQEGQPALTATGVSVSVSVAVAGTPASALAIALASTRASPVRAASPTEEGRSYIRRPC